MPVLRKINSARQQPVTLSALARDLGLSSATVSFVLNGNARRHRIHQKTVDRVLKAAEKHGYVPNEAARYLKRQKTGVIGMILGDISHDRAYFTTKGMLPVLEKEGYTPFISTSFWDVERHARQILSFAQRRAEGIICEPFPEAIESYRQILRHGTPLVFLADALEEMPEVSYVAWDAGAAARTAVRHLVDIGRRRIGYVGHQWPSRSGRAIYKGFAATLASVGLHSEPAWCMHIVYPQTVERFVEELLERDGPRPDAFFATNDAIALSLLSVLEGSGVMVPDDMAIIGLGDFPISSAYGGRYGAGLSTVRQPLVEIGQQAAEVMLQLIRSPRTKPVHRLIESNELVIRRTTVPGRNERSESRASGSGLNGSTSNTTTKGDPRGGNRQR